MKTIINAQIVAHSVNEQGDELISVLATFPRIILAEVNTHRMLSKNTSSSRAIPFNKMVESVQNDPFIPIAWQKDHKGMQGTEYFGSELFETHKPDNWIQPEDAEEDETYVETLTAEWLMYRDSVVEDAIRFNSLGVTKQLCNRLLEPFMWTTMLITGSKEGWDNFFKLRCPQYELPYETMSKGKIIEKGNLIFRSRKSILIDKPEYSNYTDLDWLKINKGQAEIHIMDLAEKIYDAVNESNPKVLKPGEWHIPFLDKIETDFEETAIKVSTAMAARTSYTVVGNEKEIDVDAMVVLHDRLLAQDPPHSSPLEHCARCMSDSEYRMFYKGKSAYINASGGIFPHEAYGWCNNFKGFIPYRYLVDNNLSM